VLEVDLFGAPAVRQAVEDDLDDLHIGVVDPGNTPVVALEMRCGDHRHGSSPGAHYPPSVRRPSNESRRGLGLDTASPTRHDPAP
jgi:hypothetical protein